jgi:hypothetical protein
MSTYQEHGEKIDYCFGYSTVIENDFQDYMWLFTSFGGIFDVHLVNIVIYDVKYDKGQLSKVDTIYSDLKKYI